MEVFVVAVIVRFFVAQALPSHAVKEFVPGSIWKVTWPLPLTGVFGPERRVPGRNPCCGTRP